MAVTICLMKNGMSINIFLTFMCMCNLSGFAMCNGINIHVAVVLKYFYLKNVNLWRKNLEKKKIDSTFFTWKDFRKRINFVILVKIEKMEGEP